MPAQIRLASQAYQHLQPESIFVVREARKISASRQRKKEDGRTGRELRNQQISKRGSW